MISLEKEGSSDAGQVLRDLAALSRRLRWSWQWTQNSYRRQDSFGPFRWTRRCIAEALGYVNACKETVALIIRVANDKEKDRYMDVIHFNDDRGRTFQDIRDVIRESQRRAQKWLVM